MAETRLQWAAQLLAVAQCLADIWHSHPAIPWQQSIIFMVAAGEAVRAISTLAVAAGICGIDMAKLWLATKPCPTSVMINVITNNRFRIYFASFANDVSYIMLLNSQIQPHPTLSAAILAITHIL